FYIIVEKLFNGSKIGYRFRWLRNVLGGGTCFFYRLGKCHRWEITKIDEFLFTIEEVSVNEGLTARWVCLHTKPSCSSSGRCLPGVERRFFRLQPTYFTVCQKSTSHRFRVKLW